MSPLYIKDGKLLVVNNALANSSDCCCDCWQKTLIFSGVPGGQDLRPCSAEIKETKFLVIPDDVCVPACATVSWGADDDIAINGLRLNGTWSVGLMADCQFGPGCCASEGVRKICINDRNLQIDLIDTVGVGWGGRVTIKICPTDCGCSPGDPSECDGVPAGCVPDCVPGV